MFNVTATTEIYTGDDPLSLHDALPIFASNSLFTVVEQSNAHIRFCLTQTPESLTVYPYQFELYVTYRLNGRKLIIEWEVVNTDNKTIYFQLGGHPSFNYENFNAEDEVHGYISFDNTKNLQTRLIGDQGCASNEYEPVPLDAEGMLPLTNTAFALDTYVLENKQVKEATLHNKERKAYAKVKFSTAVLCIWSPCDGKAPFVCIEPWAGLCDTVGFEGDISERNFINSAPVNGKYSTSYEIELL